MVAQPSNASDAKVVLADGQGAVRGRTAEGEERSRLWVRWRGIEPKLDDYAALRSSRTEVVILEPLPNKAPGTVHQRP